MITKIFDGKKIIIRELTKNDLKNVKKFQDFINSFIKEDAMIAANRKVSLKEEKNWLKNQYECVKTKKLIHFFAEHNNKLVGSLEIKRQRGRENHVGEFGITIRNGYRRIGLGKYLGKEIIKLAKKRLGIKIVRLRVLCINKPAQKLYRKLGFKKVARLPKQVQYKGKLVDDFIMVKYL
jgi:RimJ/RimL family protein N-acetyltransferase